MAKLKYILIFRYNKKVMKYKLIKEYPGSPKVGTIITSVRSYYNDIKVEMYPEFWEEVIEKDYEILEYYQKEFTYSKNHVNWTYIFKQNYPIKTIKRLSDGEIFTVGDRLRDHSEPISEIILEPKDKNDKRLLPWLACGFNSGSCLRDAEKKMMSDDAEHLTFLYFRLRDVHGDDENLPSMLKLKEIINRI